MAEPPAPDQLYFSTEWDQACEDYVTERLREYNRPHASPLWQDPPQPPAPLHVYAADGTGTLIGGLVGLTHAVPEWLEVSTLWVDEAWRGRGVGRQLMERAEAEARRRGCRFVRLATGQFQAPGFYHKMGYRLYGTLADLPQGETVFFFTKALGGTEIED